MALDAQKLAKKLHDSLANKADKDGKPIPISNMTKAYAEGIVAALKTALVNHLPGTVLGVTAPGSPLSGGSAVGGIITILPAAMLAKTMAGVDPGAAAQLSAENTAIIGYLGTGLVSFSSGNITGTCTNTPLSPGPLAAGAGQNGTILGLTGAGALSAVAAAGVVGPDAINHYTALIDYILAEAKASYATGTIQGVCPPGGGPLTLGAGIGGTFA